MQTQLNRRDIGFTIISRFEEAVRYYLSEKLPIYFGDFTEGIPKGVIEKAKSRVINPTWNHPIELLEDTDFMDLMEIIFYNNMFLKYFSEINISKEQFKNNFAELYNLRCKIDHCRGNFTSFDLDKLKEISQNLAVYLDTAGNEYNNFIKNVEESPEKIKFIETPIGFSDDLLINEIPNNIPTPDYEYEGGFVGRDRDIKEITKLLEGDLHRVITITGAGGVGKTALALKVIQKLLCSSNIKFDGIIWLSAKETKLSYLGIEDFEPAIKNYEQFLETISKVMGFETREKTIEKKEKDIEIIFDTCKCILIVVDNLETIHDEKIRNFILDSHSNAKFLITSRKGLGQVERRYELKELREKEAVQLFKLIARDKNLKDLVALDEKIIAEYVKKVFYYPLAIKWLIGQITLGKSINKVIDSINESKSDISKFCFAQIYKEVSDSARKILCALSCFEEPPSAGILNYVVNIDQNDFDDGIEELILVSLVVPEQHKIDHNQLSRHFVLLPLTHGYVKQQLDKNSILKRDIEERMRTVNITIEEAEKAKNQYRFSLSNMGAITGEEKIAAMLAHTAYQKYQSGRYEDAFSDYKRAIEIAPDFTSIYRNWAVMESLEGHATEADNLMKKAVSINPNDIQLWLTWGNMKMKGEKSKEALSYYQKAYDLSPEDNVVLNSLGQAKCRMGQHAEADKLFKAALQKESNDLSVKHEIINKTSLADNLKRWAIVLKEDRNFTEAEIKFKEALENIEYVISLDKNDAQSQKLYQNILINMGYFYKNSNPEQALDYFKRCICKDPVKYKEACNTLIASIQSAKILFELGKIDEAKKILSPNMLNFKEPLNRNSKLKEQFYEIWDELYKTSLTGKIIRDVSNKGFVIIESSCSPGDTYLGHFNDFIPAITRPAMPLNDQTVEFIPADKNNRKIAISIKFKN